MRNAAFEDSSRFEQIEKASSPIDVTDDGIVICVSELHSEKASSPIDVTDDGIVICVSELHSEKAKFPIDVTDDGIVTTFNFSFGILALNSSIVYPASGFGSCLIASFGCYL